VVLEALGIGTPVITTQCGGIQEIIEDSTWNTNFSEYQYRTSKNQSVIINRYDHASLILMDCQSMQISDELVMLFTAESKFWLDKLDQESVEFGQENYQHLRWKNAYNFRKKYSLARFIQRWQRIFNNL
jgi:glycosyltransferase involved in cell wall biosynthesis